VIKTMDYSGGPWHYLQSDTELFKQWFSNTSYVTLDEAGLYFYYQITTT